MKEYDLTNRKPADISKELRGCMRRLTAARELMELTALPVELMQPVEVAIEHIKFLEADLNIELCAFERRHGILPK